VTDEPDDAAWCGLVVRDGAKAEPEERIGKLPAPVKADIKEEPGENHGAVIATASNPLVSYMTTDPPKCFGISATAAAGGVKRLTFSKVGDTNATVVSVNGGKTEFGGADGRWTRNGQTLAGIPDSAGAIQGPHPPWL